MLRDPRIFDEPDKYYPERWLASENPNASKLPDPTTIAFGFGKRICPGRFLAERIGFTFGMAILTSFDIVPMPGESIPTSWEFEDSAVR